MHPNHQTGPMSRLDHRPGPPGRRRHEPGDPLRRALDRVGDRWVLLIVRSLLDGPHRFGQLADGLGVAPNVLAQRLRQLEADGVVVATRYSDRPPRSSYELTAPGRELAGALALLAQWGARRGGGDAEAFHARCGSPIETRAWCPTCEQIVARDEHPSTYEI
ncbi:MAG: transcriptional regulator, hxlr family protein [Acidimicrobiales bacterium]|nr:transcriptional regulator, hxlr family protein [Acidimicrobiales bacterium]